VTALSSEKGVDYTVDVRGPRYEPEGGVQKARESPSRGVISCDW